MWFYRPGGGGGGCNWFTDLSCYRNTTTVIHAPSVYNIGEPDVLCVGHASGQLRRTIAEQDSNLRLVIQTRFAHERRRHFRWKRAAHDFNRTDGWLNEGQRKRPGSSGAAQDHPCIS